MGLEKLAVRSVRTGSFVRRVQICRARFVLSLLPVLLAVVPIASGQNVRDGFDPGITNAVTALAVQADGKILIGGEFLMVAGVVRTNFARLNPDGTLDTAFAPRIAAKFARNARKPLLVQIDGKALLPGSYVSESGQSVEGLIRLNQDGGVDESFRSFYGEANSWPVAIQNGGYILVRSNSAVFRLNSDGSLNTTIPTGVPNGINLAVQQDGKLLVAGGPFANDGLGNQILRRFGADGVRDLSFTPRVRWAASVVEYTTIESLAVQPDGKVLIGGWFSFVNEQPCGDFARINRDGSLDTNFFAGPYEANHSGHPRTILVQPDGKILVLTDGSVRRHLPDGRLDFSLRIWAGAKCAALQPDGKILLGGLFTSTNGTPPRGLIRLYPDGTLDNDFIGLPLYPHAVAVQPDGKILLGAFQTANEGEFSGNCLWRFGLEGKRDAAFQPAVATNVQAICVQTDGSVVMGGDLGQVGGQLKWHLARINGVAGGLDGGFNPQVDASIWTVAQQDDGKILAGGVFNTVNGQTRRRLARFQTNGLADGTFSSTVFSSTNCVECLNVAQTILQPDGKVMVSGSFKLLNGGGRTNLARLNSDGTLDVTFRPVVNGSIAALQRDGKIFVNYGPFLTNALVRLNADGSRDTGFTLGVTGLVSHVALQSDGKIMMTVEMEPAVGSVVRLHQDGTRDTAFDDVSAEFFWPDGIILQFDGKILLPGPFPIRRLSNPTASLQSVLVESGGREILWRRSGSSPEVERVVFERSTDGTNFAFLGAGIPGIEGWRMTNATIPLFQNVYIRARGRLSTGWDNASSSLIESVVQLYVTELPRIVFTYRGNGPEPSLEFHFPNPDHIPYGLRATTNLSLPEYQWQRLPPPEFDFLDLEGRYVFWDVATNSARFYRLIAP